MLLEIIISISLFSVVATAMVVALNQLARTTTIAQKESRIFERMESVMIEVIHRPGFQMVPGKTSFPADATGVMVDVTVKEEPLVSSSGVSLDYMFRVKLTGRLVAEPDIQRSLEQVIFSAPVR